MPPKAGLALFTQPYLDETALYIDGGHTGDVDKTALRINLKTAFNTENTEKKHLGMGDRGQSVKTALALRFSPCPPCTP